LTSMTQPLGQGALATGPVMGPFVAFMGKASVLRDADKRLGNPAREIIPQTR
jgi:hypothetical protein